MSASTRKQHPSPPQPLIPERYFDVPSQRLYYLSLGALLQAIRLFDFVRPSNWNDNRLQLCRKWIVVDFSYLFVLAMLRIPRLTYSKATTALFIILLWLLDGVMFGGISLNMRSQLKTTKTSHNTMIPFASESPSFIDYLAPFSLGLIQSSHARDQHLLGQHTIRMSPISTAHLNPDSEKFCFSSAPGYVLLPVLLNNTNIGGLRYSISSLDAPNQLAFVDVSVKHLEQNHQERMQVISTPSHPSADNEEDEYDDDDHNDDDDHRINASPLQKTQSLVYIRIPRPGTVRLERVHDTSQNEARLVPSEVVIAPCPSVAFVDTAEHTNNDAVRCSGQDNNLDLMIDVYGVPPLSLRWLKIINSTREQFLVEGIESDHDHGTWIPGGTGAGNSGEIIEKRFIPKEIKIPLAISLNEPGTHLYALEEIVDGLGNIVRVGTDATTVDNDMISKTKTTRSFLVLRKALASFSDCNLQHPKPLLVGSEASLTISTRDADDFDAPWEVTLQYHPPSEPENSKVYKPWKKVLKTQGQNKKISVQASAPGQYNIVSIKGKHCAGEVLSPDTCSVVEKPLPFAEIEWKRIHECSGDTGVSASLVLHGTPPFVVSYKTQRNNEPPREELKKFFTSRGTLTLQPERSGHYTFTFVSMSDANYQKVELQGPSIDQVIHPLAAAEFANTGEKTRTVSNCAGENVDVDVDLRGTGPWNLELQVIGPKSSEKIRVDGIETPRKRIQVPIPKSLQKNGGTFEIDLVSIEDAYKCKRPISVPGIIVNVKRTWPTAQFYGKSQARHVIITEGEQARLPLRLTGDGPWRIKYRLQEPEGKVFTAVVHSPNDSLNVKEKGIYEIVEVKDSLCPGTIDADAATYEVKYVPRPSAKLSPSTVSKYDSYNGSYILPSICEGISDHVDLDLTGKPPFQITYNIAQDSETGGTKVIGQPTFNSIQPRTRFQLQTSIPGRMYYEVKQIGDAAYPLNKNNIVIPKSQRLLFEQHVSQRPSVRFKNRNRMTYCLNDPLVAPDTASPDGILLFEGTPPFTLTLTVKDLAASDTETHTIQVNDHVWRLSLPSYVFKSIGAHLVSIDSVADASNCAQSALDPMFSSVWVDVAETAAIIPFERREDVCVGDIMQFQLEGIPPWTVGYRVNNKQHSQEVKTSPFSLLSSHPGELVITSIAHQQKMCKASVPDLRFTVHPLPSAQVGHGKRIFQDIHEGDQAEIVFTLIGEPPFTFTYQRAEPSPKKGGKPGKVLETHTVSRVVTHEYSIFSALEGTWTVTSISDRYCRYPPMHPEGDTPRS